MVIRLAAAMCNDATVGSIAANSTSSVLAPSKIGEALGEPQQTTDSKVAISDSSHSERANASKYNV